MDAPITPYHSQDDAVHPLDIGEAPAGSHHSSHRTLFQQQREDVPLWHIHALY